jgi:hypothetical protein
MRSMSNTAVNIGMRFWNDKNERISGLKLPECACLFAQICLNCHFIN